MSRTLQKTGEEMEKAEASQQAFLKMISGLLGNSTFNLNVIVFCLNLYNGAQKLYKMWHLKSNLNQT